VKRSALFLAALVLGGVTLSAHNWPQWRGPLATGATTESGLPDRWSTATGENIAWKLPMPSRSGATPIIWNDTIFLNVAQKPDSGDLELWAIDRRSGQINWKKPVAVGNFKINKQNMSSPSPVTDGRTVWVLTGLGVLKAFDIK
jgi:outer membrane protein assembly factor BamB